MQIALMTMKIMKTRIRRRLKGQMKMTFQLMAMMLFASVISVRRTYVLHVGTVQYVPILIFALNVSMDYPF